MSSPEVAAAVGEGPERKKDQKEQSNKQPVRTDATRSVLDQLNTKRAELAQVAAALAQAEIAMDTDKVIAARQRVEILRGFISRLETEAREELEQEGQRRAKAWLKKTTKEVAAIAQKVAAAQDVVREKIKAAVEAIKVEVALRASVEQFALSDEVLSARWALPRSFTRTSVQLPEREDWVMPILLASDSMRPERLRLQGLVISNTASDTPETRRRNAVKAVAGFNTTRLPAEVQAILFEAPISPNVSETHAERAHAEASAAVIGTGSGDAVLEQARVETLALIKLGVPNAGVHRG